MKVLLLFTNMELLKLLFQDNIITRPPRTVLCNRKVRILRIIFKEENWDTENQQIYSDIIYSLNRDVVSTSRPIIADVRIFTSASKESFKIVQTCGRHKDT